MPANKVRERLTGIEVLLPAAAIIAPGDLLIFGHGSHYIVGVANDGQNLTTKPPYYSNTGYISLDTEGAFSFTVIAQVQKSPSAGAAINPGDPIYADQGTFDPATGITYGVTLDADSSGTCIGIAEQALAAGTTGTIRVSLKGSAA